jgi:hypothetical protein
MVCYCVPKTRRSRTSPGPLRSMASLCRPGASLGHSRAPSVCMLNLAAAARAHAALQHRRAPCKRSKKRPMRSKGGEALRRHNRPAPPSVVAETRGQQGPSALAAGEKIAPKPPRPGRLCPGQTGPGRVAATRRPRRERSVVFGCIRLGTCSPDALCLARAPERHGAACQDIGAEQWARVYASPARCAAVSV